MTAVEWKTEIRKAVEAADRGNQAPLDRMVRVLEDAQEVKTLLHSVKIAERNRVGNDGTCQPLSGSP